jgi:hypothetical protein
MDFFMLNQPCMPEGKETPLGHGPWISFFWGQWAVLGFEHKALHLLDRCSTACATHPAPFFSGYFGESVSPFSNTSILNPPISASHCSWDDSAHHQAQLVC